MIITNKDEQLIQGLERAKAMYNRKKQLDPDKIDLERINHNIRCIDIIISSFDKYGRLAEVQTSLAKKLIAEVNEKEKVR